MIFELQQVPPQPVPGDLPIPPVPGPGPAPFPDPVTDPTQVPPPVTDPDVVDPMPGSVPQPMIAARSIARNPSQTVAF